MWHRCTPCSTGWRKEDGLRDAGSTRRASAAAATTSSQWMAERFYARSAATGRHSWPPSDASPGCAMPDWKAEIAMLLAECNLEPSREAAIVEELAGHAEDRYRELLRQGATRAVAYQRTLAELSDAGLPYGVTNLDSPARALFSRRFPFAARILLKYWKLAAVAVFSLAIAIAAGVAGLSLFNALLVRPPVAAAPSGLLTVYSSTASHPADQLSVSEYRYYRDRNHVFSKLAAF